MKLSDSLIEEMWFAEDDVEDRIEEAKESLAVTVAEIEGLRPLPIVAQRIIALLGNDDFGVKQLGEIVREDPAIASRVLRVANSAYFSRGVSISTIEDSVVRVGSRTVQDIVLGVAAMTMFADEDGFGLQVRDHCVGTAAIAKYLSEHLMRVKTPEIFLAGLMHDVGKLLMMQAKVMDYSDFDDESREEANIAHVLETDDLGYDHALLMGVVLAVWDFPKPIPTIVGLHHQAGRAYMIGKKTAYLVSLLRLADQLDPILRKHQEVDEEALDELASSPDCEIVEISAQHLRDAWADLYQARLEGLTLFM